MAFVTASDIRRFETSLLERITGFIAEMQHAKLRRVVYNRTVDELAKLSDRELADINIARADIRAIAWQHAKKIA